MKIRLSVDGKKITATLIDSKTTRDFVSLLPLTLTLNASIAKTACRSPTPASTSSEK